MSPAERVLFTSPQFLRFSVSLVFVNAVLEVLAEPFRSVSFWAIVFIQVVFKAATSTRSAFYVRIFDFPVNNIAFLHKRKQERQLVEVDKLLSINGRKIPIIAEAKQKADLWPSQVIIALRLTVVSWSSRTIPRTLTCAISYSEIIPFWGVVVTQKSSFTNRHLKHSEARKTWVNNLPPDSQLKIGIFPCNRLDCGTCPFINSLTE